MFGFDWVIFHLDLGMYLLQVQPVFVQAGSVWTQLLTALTIGILTAFAFQFLVTNLGIAVGISILGVRETQPDRAIDDSFDPADRLSEDQPEDQSEDQLSEKAVTESDQTNSHLSTMAGLGILLTVNLALFSACFLATKFSQVSSPVAGAITGIVIWSAYFLLLLWISSTAVSSLVGSVLGATTGGLRRIISTIAAALSNTKDESVTQEQMIATIREEMQAALNAVNLQQRVAAQMQTILATEMPRAQPQAASSTLDEQPVSNEQPVSTQQPDRERATQLWQELQTYLLNTRSSNLTSKRVDRKVHKLLQSHQVETFNQNIGLIFDRTKIIQILAQREDLSDRKKRRIANQVEVMCQDYGYNYSSHSDRSDASSAEAPQSGVPQALSQATALLLKSASGTALKQLPDLPELLQRLQTTIPNWTEVAPIVLPAVLAKIRDSIDSTAAAASEDHSDHAALKQNLDRLIEYSQLGAVGLNHALGKPIEYLQDRSVQQIESIQQTARTKIEQVKQQTQQRLESTRKAAATAAWWLFLTALTAALSAALAGTLATGFNITQLLS